MQYLMHIFLLFGDGTITISPPPPHKNFSGTSRQPRKLIFGMQTYLNPTKRQCGRRPQFCLRMEDDLKFLQMEDNLNFGVNGRSPLFCQIENNLNILVI